MPKPKKPGLLQRGIFLAITVGCFYLMYSRLEGAAAREGMALLPYMREVFSHVAWVPWLGLMVVYSCFYFLVDTRVTTSVLNWFIDPNIRYRDILPIRASAYIISLVMAFHVIGVSMATNKILVAIMVTVLSYMMVSRIRFRSMKDLRMTKRTLAVVALLIMTAIVVAVRISQPAVLIFLASTYIALGLVEELWLTGKSRREAREAAVAAPVAMGRPLPMEPPVSCR